VALSGKPAVTEYIVKDHTTSNRVLLLLLFTMMMMVVVVRNVVGRWKQKFLPTCRKC